jgi:putative acetyltransferase
VIELWKPEHEAGAIEVVRSVFDEYGFTWDETDYHADLYDVPGHYLEDGCPFYVFLDEDQVAGTVALDLFPAIVGLAGNLVDQGGKTRIAGADCSLERLYVHPTARRKGVGSRLFVHVLQEAKRLGRSRMEIWSDKRFLDAHRLYQRFGAIVVGDRICDDPDESPEWGLVLDIPG